MICYTDGSCLGNGKNQNSGGFGVVVVDENDSLIELYQKFSENTTNNREEMKAIMWVMCKYGRENPIIYSDSNYCVQTFNEWIFNWQRNGWIKASDKKPPENLDILKDYMYLYDLGFRVNLKKVKGHAGNKWNELADKLATGKEVL
jgi:ribonuclease HI